MSMLPRDVPDYSDGVTKQAFKDSCDINKMLKRAQKTGTISHLLKYPEAVYGEFENIDLLTAHERIKKAETIFNDLPSEVRREFNGNAFSFIAFASNPENNARLAELLPKIAEPGSYFPNPVKRQAAPDSVPATPPQGTPPPADTPA